MPATWHALSRAQRAPPTELVANETRSKGVAGKKGRQRGAREAGKGLAYLAAHEFLKAPPERRRERQGHGVSVTRDSKTAACTSHGSA